MASIQEFNEINRRLTAALAEHQRQLTTIAGIRAELRRVKRQGIMAEPISTVSAPQPVPAFLQKPPLNTTALKQELAQVFSTEPAYVPKPKKPLTEWTVDEILAENIKRAAQGLPEMWGTEEALEELAKSPPPA